MEGHRFPRAYALGYYFVAPFGGFGHLYDRWLGLFALGYCFVALFGGSDKARRAS